jgi:hypothetical protein
MGAGTLLPGSPGALSLSEAAPDAPSLLLIAMAIVPTPFKCGTLIPDPDGLLLVLATDAGGETVLSWTSFPAQLGGLALELQYVVLDAGAPCGFALSNALKMTVP